VIGFKEGLNGLIQWRLGVVDRLGVDLKAHGLTHTPCRRRLMGRGQTGLAHRRSFRPLGRARFDDRSNVYSRRPCRSAQAVATAELGVSVPGTVAQPPFSMINRRSHHEALLNPLLASPRSGRRGPRPRRSRRRMRAASQERATWSSKVQARLPAITGAAIRQPPVNS
jgi:hypothetical protein